MGIMYSSVVSHSSSSSSNAQLLSASHAALSSCILQMMPPSKRSHATSLVGYVPAAVAAPRRARAAVERRMVFMAT